MSLTAVYRIKESTGVQEIRDYHIELGIHLDERAFNETSPLKVTVVDESPFSTVVRASTDQAGLVGLIRRLHQQGFVLLSIRREG
jgi:hypothetical protein